MRSVIAVAAAVVLAGCPDREVSEVEPDQVRIEDKTFPIEINNDVDILFVVDDSGSMVQEQASLQANFPRFIDVLDNLEGGLPDVHLGVVTSNMGTLGVSIDTRCGPAMGDDGIMHTAVDSQLGTDRFISDIAGATPGTRVTNYPQGTTDLVAEFGKIADVGSLGCGFEQHLAAMKRGLENPTNTGFRRPDAHLAVVILADEDDCSTSNPALFTDNSLGPLDDFRCFAHGIVCDQPANDRGQHTNCRLADPSPYVNPPAGYVQFLDGLVESPQSVIVAAITGDREPVIVVDNVDQPQNADLRYSCEYPNPSDPSNPQQAFPAIRIGAFVDGFGAAGQQTTICTDDLSGPIAAVGELIAEQIGNPCIVYDLADTDLSTPEPDYECQVSLQSAPNDIDAFDDPIPECDASASVQPCWRLVPQPRCDTYPTGLALEIVRGAETPDTAFIHAQCVVE
jgi:hypothetical protein